MTFGLVGIGDATSDAIAAAAAGATAGAGYTGPTSDSSTPTPTPSMWDQFTNALTNAGEFIIAPVGYAAGSATKQAANNAGVPAGVLSGGLVFVALAFAALVVITNMKGK